MIEIKQYRNEWKYILSDAKLEAIDFKLKTIMPCDPNAKSDGKYVIHSLYFDDIYDACMRDNDQGLSQRYKYRIRYYDDDVSYIRLERKEKLQERCYKESCLLTREQYAKILEEDYFDVFWSTENKLLRAFCVCCVTKGLRPKAIIEYERRAYIEPATNVRITLDTNISASYEVEEFLQGTYAKFPLQEKMMQVLEAKFDYILPSYIRHVITDEELVRTSFSKYCLGRKQLRRKGL